MKTFGKYVFVFLCIIAAGIFIYPGLYKYDKLDQKYPVKINRITGHTEILTPSGWNDVDNYNDANKKMAEYKQEIIKKISSQNDEIVNTVLGIVREELDQYQNEEYSFSRSEAFRENQLTPEGNILTTDTFTEGDTLERVREIMGTPDSISETGPYVTWMYGLSIVKFKDGKVNGWNNIEGNLPIK